MDQLDDLWYSTNWEMANLSRIKDGLEEEVRALKRHKAASNLLHRVQAWAH